MKWTFHSTVSALCYSLLERVGGRGPARAAALNDTVRFVLEQQGRMPDFLRAPMFALTLVFDAHAVLRGGLFHKLEPAARAAHVAAWRNGFGFQRDFVRFYESVALLSWFSLMEGELSES